MVGDGAMRIEPPEPDEAARQARELMGKESDLDLRILFDLLGAPKRYSDLKPLLGDRGDHNLTVALERLQDRGLVDRRTDARGDTATHTYQVTDLGVQVALHAHTSRVIDEAQGRLTGGGA